MSTISLAVSEDEDIKVRKRLEREEKQEFGSDVIYETLMIKTGLSPTELKEIKDIFELVDLDHSGAISSDELLTLMNTLGLRSNQMEIENMIQETDPDNTGEIDFESFVTAVSKKVQTEYTQDELKRGFRRYVLRSLQIAPLY
jgi:Ca2+-binding EF-hand superfamily protein